MEHATWLIGLMPAGLIVGFALVYLVPRIPIWGWIVIATVAAYLQHTI